MEYAGNVDACSHLTACPGCPRYLTPGFGPVARATLERLCAGAGLPEPEFISGARFHFRVRARLAVRGRTRAPLIGIFESGSHRVVDIPECQVHHPLVNECAQVLREAIRQTGTSIYSEESQRGSVRYLQVVVERPSASAQVVLTTNDSDQRAVLPLLDYLQAGIGEGLHSLFWNGNTSSGNAILGDRFDAVHGPAALREEIGGAEVFFPPGAFGQSNLDLACRLVEQVHDWVPSAAGIAELYCGVGAIGLGLVGRSRWVRFNEVSPSGLQGLALGIAALPQAVQGRATVHPGPAENCVDVLEEADVAILDPPRKGVPRSVIHALGRSAVQRVVYVSCSLSSFERDAEQLGERGFRMRELKVFDLFPHTEHVETVALFLRS